MSDIELFRTTSIRKIAVGLVDSNIVNGIDDFQSGKFLQVRDISETNRHVIINYDLEGRLLSIELGEQYRTNTIKIFERNYNGELYVFYENCKNLRIGHDGINYYYDYYHRKINSDLKIAEKLIALTNQLNHEISLHQNKISNQIVFYTLVLEKDKVLYHRIDQLSIDIRDILDIAMKSNKWDNLVEDKLYLKAYPTPITVLPPEARSDRNPIYATIQITQGCRLKAERGPCSFCGSYLGINYREKTTLELIEHINVVKEFYGRSWSQVKRIFLADADPMYTKTDTLAFFKILAAEIPHVIWYEAFISTEAILSKTKNEWEELVRLGLKKVYWGVESVEKRTLQLLGKSHTKEMLYKAADLIGNIGLHVVVIIMSGIGLVSSGDESNNVINHSHIKETADFINYSNCKSVYISRLTPLPNTKLYQKIKSGQIKNLTEEEDEIQYRKMIEQVTCDVKGGYGGQFVSPLCNDI